MGKEEFQGWLKQMYLRNCKEREDHNDPKFENKDAYYSSNSSWLRQKFKEDKAEK